MNYETNSLAKEVCLFLHKKIENADLGNSKTAVLEIEARLGTLIDKETEKRVYLPLAADGLLDPEVGGWYRFESAVPQKIHREYNELFNQLFVQTNRKECKETPLHYVHTKKSDTFYETDAERARVSKDQNGDVKIERKRNLGKIDILVHNAPFDIRVSASIEEILSPDMLGAKLPLCRIKDRLSYQKDFWRVDLTQVVQTEENKETKYEIELEWVENNAWTDITKEGKGAASKIFNETSIFLNTALKIAKKKNIFI